MAVKIFDTAEVQEFLNRISGFDQQGGNERSKQILHRLVSDLFRLVDDFDISEEEYWSAVNLMNELGKAWQFSLLSPGLGFDHFLDMRSDAEDAFNHATGSTPRTIEGPLYVAGAPRSHGFARMDDDEDPDADTMWLSGQITDVTGEPIPGAQVEIWHCNSKGNYSLFDSSQTDYNLRRTIIADDNGRYRARSKLPNGYGVPPGSPTDIILKSVGRHGQRPAHIHFFVSAPGYRHLTTQINLSGDEYTWDDFAFATREGLVKDAVPVDDPEEIRKVGLDGPFKAVTFDVQLTANENPEKQIRHKRSRARETV